MRTKDSITEPHFAIRADNVYTLDFHLVALSMVLLCWPFLMVSSEFFISSSSSIDEMRLIKSLSDSIKLSSDADAEHFLLGTI